MEILKEGMTGASVREAQRLLGIAEDGWFGEATAAAVREFQRKNGLLDDGVIGSRTRAALTGAPDPRALTVSDLEDAAVRLGVPVAAIRAVAEVESAGSGFGADGRPVILFERHVFYRVLGQAGYDVAGLVRSVPNIVNPKRGGYAGGVAEWSRFRSAEAIDPERAVEAASWGRYQVMGYHWQALGYRSAGEFRLKMYEDEGEHLAAFIRFIEADGALSKALKARKWAEFARLYNGPAYKENLYDVRLARAWEKYRGDV